MYTSHLDPLCQENDRLRACVENLRREVCELRITAQGLESLETRFAGNAKQAQRALGHRGAVQSACEVC